MQPGIYECLDNATYHAGPGESKSLLDLVRISPAHYRARTTDAANDGPAMNHTPTPAQAFGTAFHALLLEPGEFAKNYTLGPRMSDVPGVVESRDQLLAMVAEVNAGKKPKLATSGSKAELAARVTATYEEEQLPESLRMDVAAATGAELKDELARLNETRGGLIPTTGSMEVLAQLLRDAGRPVTLWQEVKAEWMRNNGHLQVLTPEHWDQLHSMRDAVMAHPAARALLSRDGVAEHSVYWVDEATGMLCRCRPDWWLQSEGILVDVKTTEDASPAGFARSIHKWRYHVQDAFYRDGINAMREQVRPDPFTEPQAKPAAIKAFLFLAVEKDACVVDGYAKGVGVYALDAASVELGRAEYVKDLRRIQDCRKQARWPGYGDAVQGIELPPYAMRAAMDDAA